MRIRRLLGAACALALLLCSNMRCVYTVEAAGEELPGLWSRAEIEAASSAALAAAEEVARSESALPELELHPRLSFSPARAAGVDGGSGGLAVELLGKCSGVEPAWRVFVNGEELGTTDDRSVLGELLDGLLASRISREAVSARLTGDIDFALVCIPEGCATEGPLLAEAICSAAPVVYTTPDGEEHLALA